LLSFFCFTSLAGSEETLGVEHEYVRYYSLAEASIVTARYFASGYIFAGDPVKDEAVAMVKKAVAAIKAEGPDKAYA
jgi:hypothetical protein